MKLSTGKRQENTGGRGAGGEVGRGKLGDTLEFPAAFIPERYYATLYCVRTPEIATQFFE